MARDQLREIQKERTFRETTARAELTGRYGELDTLAKTRLAFDKEVARAQITGDFGDTYTLAKQQFLSQQTLQLQQQMLAKMGITGFTKENAPTLARELGLAEIAQRQAEAEARLREAKAQFDAQQNLAAISGIGQAIGGLGSFFQSQQLINQLSGGGGISFPSPTGGQLPGINGLQLDPNVRIALGL